MRALLAGTSGVGKDTVVDNLIGQLAAHGELASDDGGVPVGVDGRDLVVAGIEAALAEQGDELAGILAAYRPAYQLEAWRRAGQSIAERLESIAPRHSLIAAHLTYYVSGRQFSLIDLPTIRRWRPDCIITLVDDMLDIRAALQRRDAEQQTNFRLRLREILTWRTAEIAMGDLLARSLYETHPIPHYVVGVKHPAAMLYRLIFCPEQYPIIYSSFPITAVREHSDFHAAIDGIRRELHRRFIVFDPLTLDEGTPRVFEKARAAVADGIAEITVSADEARWPLDSAGALCDGRAAAYPLTLNPQEALEVWDDMENQVRYRDLTMVEQAQCVAAYRITMGGRLSTGMYSELMYASHTAEPARPVLMYADPDDDGLEHPFLRNFTHRTYYALDEWYDAIGRVAAGAGSDAARQQSLFPL